MKRHLEQLNPGDKVVVGYRSHRWETRFDGWSVESGKPVALFTDNDGMSWEAYLYHGRFCVGSSADTLKVLS